MGDERAAKVSLKLPPRRRAQPANCNADGDGDGDGDGEEQAEAGPHDSLPPMEKTKKRRKQSSVHNGEPADLAKSDVAGDNNKEDEPLLKRSQEPLRKRRKKPRRSQDLVPQGAAEGGGGRPAPERTGTGSMTRTAHVWRAMVDTDGGKVMCCVPGCPRPFLSKSGGSTGHLQIHLRERHSDTWARIRADTNSYLPGSHYEKHTLTRQGSSSSAKRRLQAARPSLAARPSEDAASSYWEGGPPHPALPSSAAGPSHAGDPSSFGGPSTLRDVHLLMPEVPPQGVEVHEVADEGRGLRTCDHVHVPALLGPQIPPQGVEVHEAGEEGRGLRTRDHVHVAPMLGPHVPPQGVEAQETGQVFSNFQPEEGRGLHTFDHVQVLPLLGPQIPPRGVEEGTILVQEVAEGVRAVPERTGGGNMTRTADVWRAMVDTDGGKVMCCVPGCPRPFLSKSGGSTSHLLNHLRERHSDTWEGILADSSMYLPGSHYEKHTLTHEGSSSSAVGRLQAARPALAARPPEIAPSSHPHPHSSSSFWEAGPPHTAQPPHSALPPPAALPPSAALPSSAAGPSYAGESSALGGPSAMLVHPGGNWQEHTWGS